MSSGEFDINGNANCPFLDGGAPVALVTGGAHRIGRSIVEQLHGDGYCILLHFRSSVVEAKSLVDKLNAIRPKSVLGYQSDFRYSSSLPNQCDAIMGFCFRTFGRCDVLVNNASAFFPTPLLPSNELNKNTEEVEIEGEISDILGSNAIAPYLLIRAFAKYQPDDLKEKRNLSIVNIIDSMVDRPLPGYTMYTMAKHALIGLTKSAALELAPLKIRVNAVAPGISLLPEEMPQKQQNLLRQKVPLEQREATPEQVAGSVAFLVSENANYITGTILNVDGGLSLSRACEGF
ncbi:putative NAD(P)-dependent oxidoreductase [Trypanosoma theileri]|uniref:Putative NAD(P)-dependent oxidoreductase n=1 Tax=Trypanosoma theileri TaxID=67003 RepID=A0A1X0NG18_9TRYP|nr:putative NAD(P)-dependent oxidoreductase [Trypanosoma theileri]ORC83714.1 putative NAD(P)-dependent oxidoreductase [Trypanosoma theileri]